MQKQYLLFGSAASMAFVLVMLGGVFGHSFVPKTSNEVALPIQAQPEIRENILVPESIREQPVSISSRPFERGDDNERLSPEEHEEEREED